MAVTSSQNNSAKRTLSKLTQLLPAITFKPSNDYLWSPKTRTVTYDTNTVASEEGSWSLLHEAAHAQLGHQSYETDLQLLLLEADAWEHARTQGLDLGVHIDNEHIQDCLDTYRDWLHGRSTCPQCTSV